MTFLVGIMLFKPPWNVRRSQNRYSNAKIPYRTAQWKFSIKILGHLFLGFLRAVKEEVMAYVTPTCGTGKCETATPENLGLKEGVRDNYLEHLSKEAPTEIKLRSFEPSARDSKTYREGYTFEVPLGKEVTFKYVKSESGDNGKYSMPADAISMNDDISYIQRKPHNGKHLYTVHLRNDFDGEMSLQIDGKRVVLSEESSQSNGKVKAEYKAAPARSKNSETQVGPILVAPQISDDAVVVTKERTAPAPITENKIDQVAAAQVEEKAEIRVGPGIFVPKEEEIHFAVAQRADIKPLEQGVRHGVPSIEQKEFWLAQHRISSRDGTAAQREDKVQEYLNARATVLQRDSEDGKILNALLDRYPRMLSGAARYSEKGEHPQFAQLNTEIGQNYRDHGLNGPYRLHFDPYRKLSVIPTAINLTLEELQEAKTIFRTIKDLTFLSNQNAGDNAITKVFADFAASIEDMKQVRPDFYNGIRELVSPIQEGADTLAISRAEKDGLAKFFRSPMDYVVEASASEHLKAKNMQLASEESVMEQLLAVDRIAQRYPNSGVDLSGFRSTLAEKIQPVVDSGRADLQTAADLFREFDKIRRLSGSRAEQQRLAEEYTQRIKNMGVYGRDVLPVLMERYETTYRYQPDKLARLKAFQIFLAKPDNFEFAVLR